MNYKKCVDSAPDHIYETIYSKLFYFPLESLIWHVPSYQSDDVAELYFQMLNRNKAIFEQSINEGQSYQSHTRLKTI